MTIKKRHSITVLILVTLLFTTIEAFSCSCVSTHSGFMIDSGTIIPINYPGVPYFNASFSKGEYNKVNDGYFTVLYMDSIGCWVEIPYTTAVMCDTIENFPQIPYEIIMPENGFQKNTWYRIKQPQPPNTRKAPGIRNGDVEIYVSADSLDLSSVEPLLTVDNEKQEFLEVLSISGDCSKWIIAKQYEVGITVPLSCRIFKNALLYECYVDGVGKWKFRRSLCSSPLPGNSWIGKGTELLYSYCGDDPAVKSDLVALDEGCYRIQLIAWMPGSNQHIMAETEIVLFCD